MPSYLYMVLSTKDSARKHLFVCVCVRVCERDKERVTMETNIVKSVALRDRDLSSVVTQIRLLQFP